MEELQPQDLEKLVQELEEESGAQESLPEEVEELLRGLQSPSRYLARKVSAEQLGTVRMSSPRIVRALITACESDSYARVRRAAAKSLQASVHHKYVQQHPDLMEATKEALRREVTELLRILQSGADVDAREVAAELLGDVEKSSARIVRTLTVKQECDPYPQVRRAAARALRAPVHQEFMQQHAGRNPEAERILFQVEGVTSHDEWQTACLVLEPAAGTITISGYREVGPALSIPVSEIAKCEIVATEEVGDRTQQSHPSGGALVGDLLVVFIALIQHGLLRASLAPAIKLIQSMADGARQQRVVYLRSVERGEPGQVATAEMAQRITAFLRQAGYAGVIPDELSEPMEFEAFLREKRRGGLLLSVAVLSSLAGLVVGLVTGLWRAEQSLSPGGGFGCGVGFLVAMAVGAAVGAVVGAAISWRNDRRAGLVMGVMSASVIASLSWFPITLWRVAEVSGPLIRW